MSQYKPILFIVGTLLSILAIFMLIPAVVDIATNNEEWINFFISAFLTFFVGISLVLTNRLSEGLTLSIKQAFILTTSSWLSVVTFSALPFLFSELNLSYTDAFFEAMSGITTTGASILVGLDALPPGILLWRSLLTGVGGIGIIVFAMAILPMLRIAGMQLFKMESSDKSDKIMPRMTQVSLAITAIYVSLIITCAIALWFAGMSTFDSINHAITVVATAGFSTHDASFAFWDNAWIEYIAALFMVISGIPFVLYIQAIRGDKNIIWKNQQVIWYLRILSGAIIILAIWLFFVKGFSVEQSLRYSVFNISSIITTSGFNSIDYSAWGGFTSTFFFMLIVIGGCTGSTTGGIKIFRFQILYQAAKTQLTQLIQPHAIVKMRYSGKTIPESITASVMSFIILYGFAFMIIAIAISLCGFDFFTSMSASAASLSNLGPALGPILGPTGNYSSVPDIGKWIIAFAMLLGRLEIFTLLVLFSPRFWRD